MSRKVRLEVEFLEDSTDRKATKDEVEVMLTEPCIDSCITVKVADTEHGGIGQHKSRIPLEPVVQQTGNFTRIISFIGVIVDFILRFGWRLWSSRK